MFYVLNPNPFTELKIEQQIPIYRFDYEHTGQLI